MLQITIELVEMLKNQSSPQDFTIIRTYTNVIQQFGSQADAEYLLDYFLLHPSDTHSDLLLKIINRWGDLSFAQKIWTRCFDSESLIEGVSEDVLTLLGILGFEPIKPILWRYATQANDYYLNKAAILGLLHFDCSEFEKEIIIEIEKTYNQNLFNEFMPSLVCKLKNPTDIFEKLYFYGNTVCSTDCNAGIILGFSLCGDIGREYFEKIIFDPNWETYSSGTGTVFWTHIGMLNLGIRFSDLYEKLLQIEHTIDLKYHLRVMLSLLKIRITSDDVLPLKFIDASHKESFTEIYAKLFKWESPNLRNNFVKLAEKEGFENEIYDLEGQLNYKIKEEIILKNFGK